MKKYVRIKQQRIVSNIDQRTRWSFRTKGRDLLAIVYMKGDKRVWKDYLLEF